LLLAAVVAGCQAASPAPLLVLLLLLEGRVCNPLTFWLRC
jgi:uncharacterized protein (TIGR03382 family)